MLLMVASFGITYGWTPDGGNGVKYIIQIPPEKVDQVARTGEISSQIPPEIRSHVSEVVIRIGHGQVPRVTPNFISRSTPAGSNRSDQPTASSIAASDPIAASDRSPVPIPAMGDPSVARPIPGFASATTSVMKPDPQSGGMNLPGGFGMTPATNSAPPSTSFSQTAQDTANNMGNQFRGAIDTSRQQMEQTLNNATDRLGQDASAQMQATANNLRDSASQLFNNNTATNDPDDPRSRLGQNNYSATDTGSRPSTDPYNRNTNTRSSFPSTDSNAAPFATSRAGMPSTSATSTSRSASSTSRAASTTSGSDDWYDLRNGSRRRPSTDPVDSNNSGSTNGGALASGNFGRLPSGLQSDSADASSRSADNSSRSTYANASYPDSNQRTANTASNGNSSNVDYDPNLTPAQAARLPKNGYSFDAENYPVDKQGYRLDQYGRRVNRQGRLLSATDTMGGPNTNSNQNDSRSNQNLYGQTGNRSDNGLYANQTDRSSSVATTGPPALGNTSNYNNGYPGNTHTNGGASQLVQPPLAPNPGSYANNGQSGMPSFTNNQAPGSQPNTGQYPTNQYPMSQYPTSQYPTSQYPTSPYPGGPAVAGNGSQPNLSPTLAPGMPGYSQYPDPRLVSLTGQNNASNSGNASNNTPIGSDDRTTSSSDRDSRSDRLATSGSALTDRTRDPAYTPEQVAAQPIFNALLLLSVVANVYLLFWLKNLRLQFRDMVATKRSNNANKSLATSV
ncbi:mu-protocadherin [Rhodopirellula sallentina SM41]|uniref:Mu-protocadherin n=2 Tax=Rhodopirellula TaxID=265488 RepID=M5U6A1_9BACT|nr:mu-protocadherin [Rhodopirellula sallentina SM41]